MTLEELIAAVDEVIQDSVWTEAKITTILNRGYLAVATGILLPGKYQLTPPLPDLYAVDTITTELSAGICDLPDDFNRDVVQVINANSESIPIEPSFMRFLSLNPEQDAGSVRACAVKGKRLLYRDIPSVAETLTVHYYQTPTPMSGDDDEPTGIPEHLQYQILVGYACSHIFNLIEDGMEGAKVNTNHWKGEHIQGLIDMEIVIGFDALPDYFELNDSDRIE
jgi:hypothetical protein